MNTRKETFTLTGKTMKTNQLDLFSLEQGNGGEHLRVVKSYESTEAYEERKRQAAERVGIIVGSDLYKTMYEKETGSNVFYVDDKTTIDQWKSEMEHLDETDEDTYVRGQW